MALTGLTKIQKIGINTATIPTLGGSENVGVVTATNFIGDGSGLTGVTGSGAGVIVRDGGSLVGTAGTINFGTNLNVSAISAGIVTVTNAASATSLTGLSDVTVTSASNGQILKHNGSVFVNTAERTYSQSSVASGSNVNLRLSDGSTDDDILITAGSNITFSSVSASGFTIAASGGGGGGGLSNVVEDSSPELGGDLNLNNRFITGSGGINVSGVVTATSFVGNITGNVTGNADTATNSTNSSHVLVTDNESTNEDNLITFVENATSSTGNVGLEMDGDLTYNPGTGNLTATKFTGSGVALTGVVTSIVAGANITLTGGPTGIVTIASSGGGGGGSGLSLANGVDNRVVTATGSTSLNGEPNLTWDGSTLGVSGNQIVGSVVVGTAVTITNGGINANLVGSAVTAYRLVVGQGGIDGTSKSMISGGAGLDMNYYAGGTAYSNHIFNLLQGGSTIERFRISQHGVFVTGIATATTFVGDLTGDVTGNATSADTVDVSGAGNADTNFYVTLADQNGAARTIKIDAGLRFNTSTNVLTAGSFVKDGGNSAQFLKADGSVDSNTYLTSGSYLENVVEDTSPQLGGDLDLNSKNITGTGEIRVVGLVTATSAVKTWTLGASGTNHYTFTGDGFTSATNDPDIYLERGKRYAFLNNSGGTHPFQIRVSSGGSAYTTGVTYHIEHQSGSNSASQGYITFNVPWDAPATLYYQCTAHSGMGGNIYIRGGNGENTNVGITRFYHPTTNGVAVFESGDAYCNIILQDSNSNTSSKPQFGVQGNAFRFQSYDGSSSTEKLRLDQYAYVTLDSGSQGNDSKPGIELKSTGYTGNITKLFQDSPNAESYLQTTERPLIIDVDSTNGTSGSRLQVNIDGDERFRITSDGQTFINTTAVTNTNDQLTVKRVASNFDEMSLTLDANTTTGSAANAFIFTKSKHSYWNGLGFQSSHGHIGAIVGKRDSTGGDSDQEIRIEIGGTHINQSEEKTWNFKNNGDLSISDGNLVVASGHGIDFSATGNSSGSMSSELLDDYEVGTWTPAYSSTGGTYAYTTQDGHYTKVGNMVTVACYIRTSSVSATTHNLVKVTGLPFAEGASLRTPGSVRCNGFQGTLDNMNYPSTWSIEAGQTFGELQRFVDGGNTDYTSSTMNNSTFVYLQATYYVS